MKNNLLGFRLWVTKCYRSGGAGGAGHEVSMKVSNGF